MKLSITDQSPVPAGFTPADALRNTIDLAKFAERLGYSRYWIAEHHATPSLASPAPEIMITRVAAETSTIRVGSGAVLLSHYSPMKVAETFRVLHALYPDRIDLGIGRAPGGTRLDAHALNPEQIRGDEFPQHLVELLAFLHSSFPEDHAYSRIHISPAMPGGPDVWLLGSSGWSADAAAQLGLPYAAAHHIGPTATRRSIERYYEMFQPSEFLSEPHALIAVGVVCADTEAEALRLYSSQRLRRLLRDQGNEGGPIPTVEEALARLGETPLAPPNDGAEWPRLLVGTIEKVQEQMEAMATALSVDELMVVTVVHDHEARKHSYELLAKAFGLQPKRD